MALVNKYYGHQNYTLHFAGEELQRQNADVISGGRNGLIDNYTRKEIEVEFILNCLYAKSKNQRTSEAHNILVLSVLEFISKIPGESDLYTTWCIGPKLARFNLEHPILMNLFGHSEMGDTRTVCQWHTRCVILKNVTTYYRDTTTKNSRIHKEDDCHFGAWNAQVEGEVD